MGKLAVVSMFAQTILFSILGPSGDIYSDVGLMVNTLTFNLGESLLLSGCRACYKRNEDEVYSIRNRPCQTCFNDNENLVCGRHPQTLNKIQELQNLESCPVDKHSDQNLLKWHLSYNYKIETFEFKVGECEGFGSLDCCISPTNESRKSDPFDSFDKKVFIYKANDAVSYCVQRENDPSNYVSGCEDNHDSMYDIKNGIGINGTFSLDNSVHNNLHGDYQDYELHDYANYSDNDYGNYSYNYLDDVTQTNNKYDIFLLTGQAKKEYCLHLFQTKKIQDYIYHLMTPNNTEMNISNPLFFKLGTSNGDLSMVPNFEFEDGCGFYIRPYEKSTKTCGADVCFIHLQKLHESTDIFDLSRWISQLGYVDGLKVGGRTCRLLRGYGRTIIFPILLNLIFSFIIFRRDVKQDNARKYEAIPAIFLFYPQWKSLKYLINYAFKHKDENKLKNDIKEFDRDVACIEPFMESSFQVRVL